MIAVAKHRLTKEYIHIEDVARGRWADAECSDCGELLTAKKGNEVSWHFAHKGDSKCGGEGNLHRYAKEVLFTEKRLTMPHLPFVPNNKTWTQEFESVSLEVPLDKFKIDCIMTGEDKKKLAVEIVVGNPVEKIKRLMFKEKGLSAVEIYLTHLKHSIISKEDLIQQITNNPNNVKWINSERYKWVDLKV